MNWIARFKTLPKSTKNLLVVGVLLALVAALPLFIWGIVTQRFLITQKAASGEPTPTPIPTPICKTGVNSFSVDTRCENNRFRYMTFACHDGFGRREGSPTSCKSSSTWSSYAQQYCLGRSNCQTPTPTPTAIPTPPTNYCTGPNGTFCSFYLCTTPPPCPTGGPCQTGGCQIKEGTCQNNQCVVISTPTPSPTPNACGGTCGSNYNCASGLVCYQGFCRNPACSTDTDCVCSSQVTRSFGILFKFAGVTDGSADGTGVTVRFVNPTWGGTSYTTPPVTANYIAGGVYSLKFSLPPTSIPAIGNYALVLKGQKHEQVKFCQPSGQISHCTASTTGNIAVFNSTEILSLNFTGIPLPPGDTYPQDGIINYVDFDRINSLLAKPYTSQTDTDKMSADLDYNGRIDIRDMFLFRKTLETKYDEY